MPAVNLTVSLNSAITSRLYPNAWSEVLLLIDEPGSGLQGAPNTQLACNNPNGTCSITGTGTGIGTYDGSQGRPNVFQGQLSQNGVTFFSVPVDPPSTGTARVLRMTNLRINATQIGLGYPVEASISSQLNVGEGSVTVGSVSRSMNFGVRTPNNSSVSDGFAVTPCATSGTQRAGVLRFSELYGGAFARRNAANFVDNNTSPQPVPQNIPGANYGTESGFYAPGLTASTGDFATIGLANAGTKLRAILNNIPAGARVFVSANRVTFTNGNPVVATSGLVARLTQNENAPFAAAAPTATLDGIPAVELPVANASATAVWEVLFKDPEDGSENADFPVWILPAGTAAGSATVNGSYAPAPPNFAGGGAASTTLPVPRFVGDASAARSLFTLGACTTIPTPLSITTTALPAGSTTSTYSSTLTGRGGTLPYTWTAGGLPAGLFLNSASGVISGLVQVAATYPITVTLQDASKTAVNAQFPLLITSPPPPQVSPTGKLTVGGRWGAIFGFDRSQRRQRPIQLLAGRRKPARRSDALVWRSDLRHAENSRTIYLHGCSGGLDRSKRVAELHYHHPAGAAGNHGGTDWPGIGGHCDQHHLWSNGRSASVPIYSRRQLPAGRELRQRYAIRHTHRGGRLQFQCHGWR